jgi:hypothetical protein
VAKAKRLYWGWWEIYSEKSVQKFKEKVNTYTKFHLHFQYAVLVVWGQTG